MQSSCLSRSLPVVVTDLLVNSCVMFQLASSVQYTSDLDVLEEEIFREYKARMRKEQQVPPRTSEPPIDHKRNQETADKSQQMSVKPTKDSAAAQPSENERRQFAKNEYQAATAGTETMHDRSSKAEGSDRTTQSVHTTNGVVEVSDGQKLTDKECRSLTRRGKRRDEADPSTGTVMKVRCSYCSANSISCRRSER